MVNNLTSVEEVRLAFRSIFKKVELDEIFEIKEKIINSMMNQKQDLTAEKILKVFTRMKIEDQVDERIQGVLSSIYAEMSSPSEVILNGSFHEIGTNLKEGTIILNGDVHSVGTFLEGGKIVVNGDVKKHAGMYMLNGILEINGLSNDLGYKMRGGKIIARNKVSGSVGEEMEGGEIWIKGDVLNYVGYNMKNGKIQIKGNIRGGVGTNMRKGIIYIYGNANHDVGTRMLDGLIVVDGEIIGKAGVKLKGGRIIARVIHHLGNIKKGEVIAQQIIEQLEDEDQVEHVKITNKIKFPQFPEF